MKYITLILGISLIGYGGYSFLKTENQIRESIKNLQPVYTTPYIQGANIFMVMLGLLMIFYSIRLFKQN